CLGALQICHPERSEGPPEMIPITMHCRDFQRKSSCKSVDEARCCDHRRRSFASLRMTVLKSAKCVNECETSQRDNVRTRRTPLEDRVGMCHLTEVAE